MPDDKLIKELEQKLVNGEYFEDPTLKRLAVITASGDKYVWNPTDKSWDKSNNKALVDVKVPQSDLFKPTDSLKAQQDWWKQDNVKALEPVKEKSQGKKWFSCTHKPRLLLEDKIGGWQVYAGKRMDVLSNVREFDVVLNLSGSTVKEEHLIPMSELSRWANYSNINEIMLDWKDFEDISLPYLFWRDVLKYLTKHKARMLVFCAGGHGRTGTALACLMIAAGWKAREAMHWIWRNYCDQAIETHAQLEYIKRIEEQKRQWFRISHKKRPNPNIVPENELDKAMATSVK